MANDILNHPNFVKKNLCNSFSDRTVQRFYKFNTSIMVSETNSWSNAAILWTSWVLQHQIIKDGSFWTLLKIQK